MFKKLMAKIGIGAASVDLRLDQDSYRLGEVMTGSIRIEGGSVEQSISELSVLLVMNAHVKGQNVSKTVQVIPVLSGFTVQPKPFVQEVPFQYQLPQHLAISTHAIHYHLHTKLDVELAVDPTDQDRVTVLPPGHIEHVFQALSLLDFRQKADSGKLTRHGQEFSFFPGRAMSAPLKELEVLFFDDQEGLRLLVELDVAQRGYFQKEVEHKAEIFISHDLLADDRVEELSRYLWEKIDSFLANPQAIPYYAAPSYAHQEHSHGQGFGGGMGGMIGGMAAGLIGGMLLNEVIEEAGDLFGVGDLFSDESEDSGDDGGGFDYGSGDDGGGFDFGDF